MEHCQSYHVLVYNNEISVFLILVTTLMRDNLSLKVHKSNHKYS